ncbi:hypothetical protein [Ruegeria marisrubri]|nr:hypothetical protein [Ruegeria marisrubri]
MGIGGALQKPSRKVPLRRGLVEEDTTALPLVLREKRQIPFEI